MIMIVSAALALPEAAGHLTAAASPSAFAVGPLGYAGRLLDRSAFVGRRFCEPSEAFRPQIGDTLDRLAHGLNDAGSR
jgi:hypothetical protein